MAGRSALACMRLAWSHATATEALVRSRLQSQLDLIERVEATKEAAEGQRSRGGAWSGRPSIRRPLGYQPALWLKAMRARRSRSYSTVIARRGEGGQGRRWRRLLKQGLVQRTRQSNPGQDE